MKLSMADLEAGLDDIRQSPAANGSLMLIVRRPASGEREVLEKGELDLELGLIGDDWINRERSRANGENLTRDNQITIMNSRAIGLIAGEKSRWALAGDQLYVDLDLSDTNLASGTILSIGEAEVEITSIPHTGCRTFADRFGVDAVEFVNSAEGKELRLRGVNARVIKPGVVRVGDRVEKVMASRPVAGD